MKDGSEQPLDMFDDLDQQTYAAFAEAASRGVSAEEFYEAANAAARSAAAPIVDGLIEESRGHAEAERANEAAIRNTILEDWRPALDMLTGTIKAVDESFEKLHDRAMAEGHQGGPEVACAAGLVARAIRTAREAEVLLINGFPAGALARARMIHEAAVIALFLYRHRDTDVAERYWFHAIVDTDRRLTGQHDHAEASGLPPPDADELTDSADAVRALVDRYGSAYRSPYGWAADVLGVHRPNLHHLIEDVGFTGLTPWLHWANHEVHPTSHGDELNLGLTPDGLEYLVIGRELRGLAEPATYTILCLRHTFDACSALGYGRDPSDMILAHTVEALTDRTIELLLSTEKQLAESDAADSDGAG